MTRRLPQHDHTAEVATAAEVEAADDPDAPLRLRAKGMAVGPSEAPGLSCAIVVDVTPTVRAFEMLAEMFEADERRRQAEARALPAKRKCRKRKTKPRV